MKTLITMKKSIVALALLILAWGVQAQEAMQDSTGLPGDNFSLEGALDLFKNSKDLEDFEKKLNIEDSGINNLDLNEDGETDYIRVVDNMEDEAHAIVLQAVISKDEAQDVAVIEIEKTGKEEAILQIVGDEDLYGPDVYAEPFDEDGNGRKGGPAFDEDVVRVVVNVWLWTPVRFIYAPLYRPWVSPWYWGYYPGWWRPWHPAPWSIYHRRVVVYRPHYHIVSTHRVVHAHRVYTPHRTSSVTVKRNITVNRSRQVGNTTVTRSTTVGTKRSSDGTKAAGVKRTTTVKNKSGDQTTVKKRTNAAGVKKEGNTVTTGRKSTKTGVQKSGNTVKAGKTTKTVKTKRKKN